MLCHLTLLYFIELINNFSNKNTKIIYVDTSCFWLISHTKLHILEDMIVIVTSNCTYKLLG